LLDRVFITSQNESLRVPFGSSLIRSGYYALKLSLLSNILS
jgi:hypothetical protein